jgi:hypothetical protein
MPTSSLALIEMSPSARWGREDWPASGLLEFGLGQEHIDEAPVFFRELVTLKSFPKLTEAAH